MTREQEANKASKSYASQMCDLCLDEYCKEKRLVCRQIREYEIAFSKGIKWADEHPKNLWHSIDDVPTGQYEIICKGNKAKCWHCDWKYIYENYPNWEQFVKTMNVEKWLYMHEL